MSMSSAPPGVPRGPQIWGNVPQRNRNFTGREKLLRQLRSQATGRADVTAVLQQALQGLGGVGKTQLAIEYAHRYSDDYELVWWVSADQPILLRSSLAALAPRLGLSVPPGRVDDALAAVLDSLRRGEPYARWLLIFDNADQPETLRDLIPQGPGQVLVTSRNHSWKNITDTIEVDVFSREESLEFLQRRVRGIDQHAAAELAEALGDLPIALEQAAALQVESGMSVRDYLDLLSETGSQLFAENKPADYPVPVAAAWSLSMNQVRKQLPIAMELLRHCAYFGPEPIPRDWLIRGKYVLDSPFGQALRDPLVVTRGMRELGRYALAKIDNSRGTIQVHRLIQRLVRDELPSEDANAMRHDVHLLLASVVPDEPDNPATWPQFNELLAHVGPSEAAVCTDRDVRRLVRHVARYLYNIGYYNDALDDSNRALKLWTDDSGPDDPDVLSLSGQTANVLWVLGRYEQAYQLRRDTLDRATASLGPENEITLRITNDHGADLRARGEFAQALTLDEQSWHQHRQVFGEDSATFMAANNLALDYGLNGRYVDALELDRQTYQDRRNFYGVDDASEVAESLGKIARDLRQAGRHREALEEAERAYLLFQDLVRRGSLSYDHAWILIQNRHLSVARRTAGLIDSALSLAESVHSTYVASSSFGPAHADTLAAAVSLGNALRSAGEYERASLLIVNTLAQYREVLGDHPFTHGCAINLGIVRRFLGDIEGAKEILTAARDALTRSLGSDHHYALTSDTALATTLSAERDHERAHDLDAAALPRFAALLGEEHPHTLACAANLAVDLSDLRRVDEASSLLESTLARYRSVLSNDHPEVRAALRGERIAIDFEPSAF